ncbi:RBBP9/YdeN family alpha/beta hydrolase [Demequina sp.]|uniref:RBBP9/YdeN family alpha/beta hydrolase n=1 Tax=Demequina sp. TaxID=2050685 RepID=UPI003A8A405E
MAESSVSFGVATADARLVIVPGLGGSGEGHWQTRWEAAHPRASRFAPASWDRPSLDDWLAALDREVRAVDEPPILVAHSLGTIVASAWMTVHPTGARAALLVAPPDAGRAQAPAVIKPFADAVRGPLSVPATLIASQDDPYGEYSHAEHVAELLGVRLHSVGAAGHINADSGLGEWAQGLTFLEELARA